MPKRVDRTNWAAFGAALAAALLAVLIHLVITEHPLIDDGPELTVAAAATPVHVAAKPGRPYQAMRPPPRKLAELNPTRPVPIEAPLRMGPEVEHSHLADELNALEHTAGEDLQVVLSLCDRYRERYGGYPVGEDNAAFTRALAGRNPQGLAFIEPDHRAIDAKGQLLDRWGQPYFFHLQSRNEIELRSAGADGKMYTGDDEILASPRTPGAMAGR